MLLEARHLAIAYGDAPAVWDASLTVGEGEVVSVIGPNGAGKSTLVRPEPDRPGRVQTGRIYIEPS